MFSIIYDNDGNIKDILANSSNKENLGIAEMNVLYVENLPAYSPYRQKLIVRNNLLQVENIELTPERERAVRKIEIMQEITRYKNLFEQNRYKLEKFVDGALSEEEYAPIRKERAEWRKQINALEDELHSLGI